MERAWILHPAAHICISEIFPHIQDSIYLAYMYSKAKREGTALYSDLLLFHLRYRRYRNPKGSLIWSFQATLADLAASKRVSNVKLDKIGPK